MKAEDVQGDLTEVLFTREEIEAKIAELAAAVDADYRDRDVLLVGVLAVLHTVEAATGPDEVVLRLGLAVVVGGAVLALHRRAAGGWLARGGRPGRWPAGRGGRPAPGRALPTTGHGLPAPGAAASVGPPG